MSHGVFIRAPHLADLQHRGVLRPEVKIRQQLAFLLYGQVLIAAASPTHRLQHLLAFLQVLSLESPHRGGLPSNRLGYLSSAEPQRSPQPQTLNSLKLRFALGLLQGLG